MLDYLNDGAKMATYIIPTIISLIFFKGSSQAFTYINLLYVIILMTDFSRRYGVLRKAREEKKDILTRIIIELLLIAKWVIPPFILGMIFATLLHKSFYIGYVIYAWIFAFIGIPKLGLFPKIEKFE